MSRYQTFKKYQNKVNELAQEKRDVYDFAHKGDPGWPAHYQFELNQIFADFIKKMESGEYNWNDEVSAACFDQIRTLREVQKTSFRSFFDAFNQIVENLEEERLSYARKAMNTLNSFDELDWAECTVKETPGYLRDLVMSWFK